MVNQKIENFQNKSNLFNIPIFKVQCLERKNTNQAVTSVEKHNLSKGMEKCVQVMILSYNLKVNVRAIEF